MKDLPLTVELNDLSEEVSIRIGWDTLINAAHYLPNYGEYTLEITDRRKFVRQVVNALNRENEIGSTSITEAIDDAFEHVFEYGGLGFVVNED